MKKFITVFFFGFSAFVLMSCGKNGGSGSAGQSDKGQGTKPDPIAQEEVITSHYQNLLQGMLKSQSGEMEFSGNQVRILSWTKLRYATENMANDNFLNCQFERKGSFRVVRTKNDIRFRVQSTSAEVKDVKVAAGYENRMGGISQGHMLEQCSEYLKRMKNVDARLVSISKDYVHFYHPESFKIFDERTKEYQIYAESFTLDYSNFYIKGSEIDYTLMFGTHYEGIYRDNRMPYSAQLGITVNKTSGDLTFNTWSNKNEKVCNDIGTFRVIYSLAYGLELRLSKPSPCVKNPAAEFVISDLNRAKDSDNIYLVTPFGNFSTIYQRARNPRR
jgi:hypothetical protein